MSVTISGLLVLAISYALRILGIEAGAGEVESFVATVLNIVSAIVVVVGLITAWYGRYRQGDVNLLGVKKR